MVVCDTFPGLYSQTQKYTPQGHSEMRTRGKKFCVSCCHKTMWKVTFLTAFISYGNFISLWHKPKAHNEQLQAAWLKDPAWPSRSSSQCYFASFFASCLRFSLLPARSIMQWWSSLLELCFNGLQKTAHSSELQSWRVLGSLGYHCGINLRAQNRIPPALRTFTLMLFLQKRPFSEATELVMRIISTPQWDDRLLFQAFGWSEAGSGALQDGDSGLCKTVLLAPGNRETALN